MSDNALRLEQILKVWENRCFFTSLVVRMNLAMGQRAACGLEGPLVHWREFRQYLLSYRHGDQFDHTRFIGDSNVGKVLFPDYISPLELASWSSSSRRMFRLSEDLQLLLEGTDLGDFQVSDIPWPFESFVVLLARPISTMVAGESIDAILVSRGSKLLEKKSAVVNFDLLPTALDNRKFLNPHVIAEIETAFRNNGRKRLNRLLQEWGPAADPLIRPIFVIDRFSNARVDSSVGAMARQANAGGKMGNNLNPAITDYPHWDAAVRIVAGLSLYLTTLPVRNKNVSSWVKPATSTVDWQSVIHDAEVCTVSSTHTLSNAERDELRVAIDDERNVIEVQSTRASYEVRAHYRRGHWRRAPGMANNPDAPRVVHVRPTLVRRDRLPEGAAPRGTEATLKSE